jgi:hypothetical protein
MNAAVLVGMSLVAAAPALKDKANPADLYGEWEFESTADSGKPGPAEPTLYRYRFNPDGTYQVFRGVKESPRRRPSKIQPKPDPAAVDFKEVGAPRRFQLDATAGPPALDFNARPADRGSPLVKAICRIEGDRLTICSAFPGTARPTAFAGPPGSDVYLFHLRRVKPKN